MYAGHLAAGLALRGRERRLPIFVYLAAAFLLDIFWIIFGVLRLDHTPWDDWSHSLAMAIFWATAFAACFWRLGRAATATIWFAVFSHYLLDLTVQGASLYPNAPRSELIPALVISYAHLFQLLVSSVLLLVFVLDERRANRLSWRTSLVVALIGMLNARFVLAS